MRRFRKFFFVLLLVVIGLPLLALLLAASALIYFDDSSGYLVSSGTQREYLLHVPESYAGGDPVPLVISLHPAFMMPSSQSRYTAWNDLADEHGFIVVYPAGSGFPKLWRGIAPGERRIQEVRFFNDLIDYLEADYTIDPARIYINGYSNGAAMTSILSCELDDRIAAAGVVAIPVQDGGGCGGGAPMPLIVFQGTQDAFAPYEGGEHALADAPMQSVPDWAGQWAARNGCKRSVAESSVATDVVLTSYTDCDDESDVLLYTIIGGGHTWPGVPRMPEWGVGKTTESIHATALMWRFFEQHRMWDLDNDGYPEP
ncbi:MAG: extracellular catalytic domain type 1 short-chain-length polyhydroxyalkanoate depolymerase, partial [Gammaproteobacteria bacterium]